MEEEAPFVAHESKKQRKRREREAKKRQRDEEEAATATAAERSAKQARPDALLDNAAYVAVFGSGARGSVVLRPEWRLPETRRLAPSHLQLLVAAAGGGAAVALSAPFVVAHQSLLRRVVVVSFGGLTLDMVDSSMSLLMQEMFPFGHAALLGPGSLSKAYHLPPMVLRVPARSDKDKKKKAGKEAALSIEECLATETQLAENGFPLTVGTDESGGVLPPFVATCPNVGGIALCAMDCEMVSTATGLELGRVSIVANDLRILYDSFVFPTSPVTDYNTRFSGLTEASLAGAPSLETVRSQILQIIGENSVIVGHSLENDLQCLRITHRRIADTALLFPHPRGGNYKRALRDLVLSYFGETIQDGEHCSVQDAGAAMRLLLLKQAKGRSFGVPTREFLSIWETVGEKSGALIMPRQLAEPLRGVTGEGIGNAALLCEAETAEEILQLTGTATGTLVYSLLPDCFDAERIRNLMCTFRQTIFDTLQPGTLVVVHGGRGSLGTLLELQGQRKSAEDDEAIAREAARIRTVPVWFHVA